MSQRMLIVTGSEGIEAIYTTGGMAFGLDIRDRTNLPRPPMDQVDPHFYEVLLLIDPIHDRAKYLEIASRAAIKARTEKVFGHHGEVLDAAKLQAIVDEESFAATVASAPSSEEEFDLEDAARKSFEVDPIEGGFVGEIEPPPTEVMPPAPVSPLVDTSPRAASDAPVGAPAESAVDQTATA